LIYERTARHDSVINGGSQDAKPNMLHGAAMERQMSGRDNDSYWSRREGWNSARESSTNSDGSKTEVNVGTNGYVHTTPSGHTTGHSTGVQHHHNGHSTNPSKGNKVDTGSKPSGPTISGIIKK
jgi:hypothetical protein